MGKSKDINMKAIRKQYESNTKAIRKQYESNYLQHPVPLTKSSTAHLTTSIKASPDVVNFDAAGLVLNAFSACVMLKLIKSTAAKVNAFSEV